MYVRCAHMIKILFPIYPYNYQYQHQDQSIPPPASDNGIKNPSIHPIQGEEEDEEEEEKNPLLSS